MDEDKEPAVPRLGARPPWGISKEILIAIIGVCGTIVVALITTSVNTYIEFKREGVEASIEARKERAALDQQKFQANSTQNQNLISGIIKAPTDKRALDAIVVLSQAGALGGDPTGAIAKSAGTLIARLSDTASERGVPGAGSSKIEADKPAKSATRLSAEPVGFKWPLTGKVISNFGTTANGERNDGINIAVPAGTPIHAAANGTVTYAGDELKDYGNLILIKHMGGYVTTYAHADHLAVSAGDFVKKGQIIGSAGATGDVLTPQLHFEIRLNTTPINPRPFLTN